MWTPLNIDSSTDDSAPAPSAAIALVAPVPASMPKASDLNVWSQETYSLNRSEAASAGFSTVFQADGKGHQSVFVAETARYKEVSDERGGMLRCGVALRLVVQVTDLDASGSLTLPMIAAKVQFGRATASTSVLLRGFRGSPKLPAFTVLTVENYGEWLKTVSTIQDLVESQPKEIDPVVLARYDENPEADSLAADIGHVWGIAELAQGQTLTSALHRYANEPDDAVRHGVEAAYAHFMPNKPADARPDETVRAAAHQMLHGMHIRT